MKQADFDFAEKVVTEFVKADLDGYFKGAFVFDPIRVEPQIDYWGGGEEYLEVIIVFDGDQKRLSSRWTVGLTSLQWRRPLHNFPQPVGSRPRGQGGAGG